MSTILVNNVTPFSGTELALTSSGTVKVDAVNVKISGSNVRVGESRVGSGGSNVVIANDATLGTSAHQRTEIKGHLSVTAQGTGGSSALIGGFITASNTVRAKSYFATALPSASSAANNNEFFMLSGSQLFSGSAFIGEGPADKAFIQPFVSSAMFVFMKKP